MSNIKIPSWMPKKIVSGGQTGADRAALDWAILHHISHGGWCPKGRLATDGPIDLMYQLQETESAGYRQRTKRNVVDSDATLILNMGELDGGTLGTVRFAEAFKKLHLVIQLDIASAVEASLQVNTWLRNGNFAALNVAGPREEKRLGIYLRVMTTLERAANL